MPRKFKPGDRVRCIQGFELILIKGHVYTITDSSNICTYQVESIKGCWWNEDRFVIFHDLKELIEKGDAETIGQLIISYRDEDHEQTSV